MLHSESVPSGVAVGCILYHFNASVRSEHLCKAEHVFFQVFSNSVPAQTNRATRTSNSCCSACCSHHQWGIHQGRTLLKITLVKPCGVVSLFPRHTRGGTLRLRSPAETPSFLLALKLFPNPYFLEVGLFFQLKLWISFRFTL